MGAYYLDVNRNRPAKVFAAGSKPSSNLEGLAETPFDTAEEAFQAAVEMRNSGKYALVRVWVEGANMVDFPAIEEILEYWKNNPEGDTP
ncbi:hypothetical protein [Mesorhizobium sp.]|uniref:hypothetical protein n=1 Tax=Mesorhizobium sp. TaxID=1871066 RepID=UPI000FE98420|nr:hypothetical protein [Mesorhizobium sp.]RWB26915.1 MAG: hypothetical protein EOQ43_29150 [Mesorhizobium sp.]